MQPAELAVGDRVRVMEPTKVPRGFIDCRTVLTVSGPSEAYWTAPGGRRITVPLLVEVDKVVD